MLGDRHMQANSKSQYLNSKQVQNSKHKIPKKSHKAIIYQILKQVQDDNHRNGNNITFDIDRGRMPRLFFYFSLESSPPQADSLRRRPLESLDPF
jgi:hypothetical protein